MMVFHKNHWWLKLNGNLRVFNPQPPKMPHPPGTKFKVFIQDFWCLIPQQKGASDSSHSDSSAIISKRRKVEVETWPLGGGGLHSGKLT